MVFPAEREGPSGSQKIAEGLLGYLSYQKTQQEKERNLQIVNDPKSSPLQRAMALEKLSPETAKMYGAQQLQAQKAEAAQKLQAQKDAAKAQKEEDFDRDLEAARGGGQQTYQPDYRTAPIVDEASLQERYRIPQGSFNIDQTAIETQPMARQSYFDNLSAEEILEPDNNQQKDLDPYRGVSDERLKVLALKYPNKAQLIEKELTRRQLDKKETLKDEREDRKFLQKEHQAQAKYQEEIDEGAKKAKNRLRSYNKFEEILDKGYNPKNWKNLVATYLKDSPWANYFKKENRAVLESIQLESFDGMKDLFGVRLSDADLRLASNKVIDPTKSNAANKAIMDYWRFQDEMKIAEQKIADELIKANDGMRPLNMRGRIREIMQERYGDEAERVIENAAYEGNPPERKQETVDGMVSFNPQNPEHIQFAQAVLQQVGGDRNRANQIIAEHFTYG